MARANIAGLPIRIMAQTGCERDGMAAVVHAQQVRTSAASMGACPNSGFGFFEVSFLSTYMTDCHAEDRRCCRRARK